MSDDQATAVKQADGEYVVVARRYRPQSFQDLVGQNQVAKALSNAINTHRVGHAYLFTGARGVGKTSTARILAKCLNCAGGPTPSPCGDCEICQSVTSGEDVDVLEIDGASNRGIDEIRQLRSNVNIRPSRSRFKIYIIDEVHMLTTAAFNALLKTLEEPPEHVKFIFCTTDPEKIPITVLSRCQRFDFAPVATDSIYQRLREIAASEGVEAEEAALRILARRAAGSMRDSQSLLEQLLSFCGSQITEDDVHAMLGTAKDGRLAVLGGHLLQRDTAAVLSEIDTAVLEGVDVGQLAEQLVGYFRDMMAAVVGCDAEAMAHTSESQFPTLKEAGASFGLETILAAIQILDQAVTRMRQSAHVRTLVEVALVRICKLEDLDELPQWISAIRGESGAAAAAASITRTGRVTQAAEKKKCEVGAAAAPDRQAEYEDTVQPLPSTADQHGETPERSEAAAASIDGEKDENSRPVPAGIKDGVPEERALDPSSIEEKWQQTLAEIGGIVAEFAGNYESVAISAPNQLVVRLNAAYNKQWCERPDVKRKLEETMSRLGGRTMRIDFAVSQASPPPPKERPVTMQSQRQKMRDLEQHPLVKEAMDLFGAEIIKVQQPRARKSQSTA